jgi:hypothetical protein
MTRAHLGQENLGGAYVDHAIVPPMRNHGIGTTIMHALMNEAAQAKFPVRVTVP